MLFLFWSGPVDAHHDHLWGEAAQQIAEDNRPSSLRSGGRLQLNFNRWADDIEHAYQGW
jgi:hypothetical protein